jgi:hypothetical protein
MTKEIKIELLIKAIKLIRTWHDVPAGNPEVWHIYWQHAPEMAPFRKFFDGIDPT